MNWYKQLSIKLLLYLMSAPPVYLSYCRCGMITRREAERLYKSFFDAIEPPNLPDDFVFSVYHECGWGCAGFFIPARYNRYVQLTNKKD